VRVCRYLNLDNNMWVQVGGFWLLVLCIVAWVVQFGVSGLDLSTMPAVDTSGWGPVLANVVFNFGFVTSVRAAPHRGGGRGGCTHTRTLNPPPLPPPRSRRG
jgi:hypothetical protein